MKVKQLEWKSMGGPWEYWYATNAVGNFSVIERYSSELLFDVVVTIGGDTIVSYTHILDDGKQLAQQYFETAVLELIDEATK